MTALPPCTIDILTYAFLSAKQCAVYIEYGMPSSSSRADAVLVRGGPSGQRAAVVVELKQRVARSVRPYACNVKVGSLVHPHPSDEALSFRDYLAELARLRRRLQDAPQLRLPPQRVASSGLTTMILEPFAKRVQLSPLFCGDRSD